MLPTAEVNASGTMLLYHCKGGTSHTEVPPVQGGPEVIKMATTAGPAPILPADDTAPQVKTNTISFKNTPQTRTHTDTTPTHKHRRSKHTFYISCCWFFSNSFTARYM